MKRIGVEGVKLTEYEMNIASHLVDPQTMKVTIISNHQSMTLTLSRQFSHFFEIAFTQTKKFFTVVCFSQVSWRDIAGLDEVINELQDTVILPFQKRHLLAGSKLFQPPKGTTASYLYKTFNFTHNFPKMEEKCYMSFDHKFNRSSAMDVNRTYFMYIHFFPLVCFFSEMCWDLD